ncbi:MAG: cohesin domain-containing protein [Candidatus Promineifilaceae bacterium]
MDLLYKAKIETRYEECGAKNFFNSGDGCSDKTDTLYLPDELDDGWDSISIYFDVLPADIDDLWTWSALNNNKPGTSPFNRSDRDGDGLAYRDEVALGTNWTLWDTDGDGLSDGFEADLQDELGTDPKKYDTDGDGLSDGLEFQLGTNINDSDSDDDGLTDGEETFHWDGSQWTGGGWFVNINGTDYWTFTTPLGNDNDGDGLKDGSEKNGGSGPNAFNLAPEFTLDAGPLQFNPNGAIGVYAAAGQTVTATVHLQNLGGAAVSNTLSFCIPSALTNVVVTATGDVVPATQINGDCYEWDFSSQNLTFLQSFDVGLTAQGGTGTVTDAITTSLAYPIGGTSQDMGSQIAYVQDNNAPTVQLSEPFSGTILIGDYFVMGGFSQDGDTWVDHVDVTVPAGTFTATDTNPWAYTWDLPDDGIVTVSAVAYDSVGNASAPASVQVTVDSLAPVITSNLPPGTTISAGESYSNTINLEGTVTDNYSGLVRVQMRYNNQPWRTIWETDTLPLSTTWNGVWELPNITQSAQGEHTLHLRAYDGFGNIGYADQTVFVDLLPPTSEMTNRTFLQDEPPHVAMNEPLNLYGVASDAGRNPLPPGPVDLNGSLNSLDDATVWLQPGAFADDDSGITLSWIGDFNGDRLGDLAVGLPAAEDGAGKVVVIDGRPGNWPIPNLGELESLAGQEPSYIGANGAGLGSTIQPAGDFNGDGFEDMLIGDPTNNRIFLVYGSPLAVSSEIQLVTSRPGKWTEIFSNANGENISGSFAAAGDVNNDTLGDILVSTTTGSTGYVYLLPGDGTPFDTQLVNILAGAVLETSNAGATVAGVGDLNDDFIDDFAVAFGGTVYLFAGGSGWSERDLTTLNTADAMASFASSDSLPTIVGAGDVNGDGVADFAYSNGATPVVVFGDAGQSFTTQTLSGFASPLSGFLAAVGDVDKDGRGDLLIGNADGDAYLIVGSNLTSAAATIEGVDSASSAPYISGADLVGDGSSDLAVVPSDSAAAGMGFNALGQAQPFYIDQNTLPVAGSGTNFVAGSNARGLANKGETQNGFLAGDVTVGPAGADYTSIQAAINSGADRVLVQPGVYYEAITLTNDVIVAGSGTGLTYLGFPKDGSATALVTADGVSNASLVNMTLLGDGSSTGMSVLNGATGIELQRTIIRDMGTAVSIDGSTADLNLKNNSIVGNVDGLIAVNCASVDVRNTIFAYNTGTALAYEGCAAIQNHQFNLYWANGTDMLPNDPGGGEIFSDPLFVDFGNNDFRVKHNSPVIDAGSPGDSVPPGAGDFADIGHMEQTGTGFVASHDYCDTCDNDGLIWGIDAFDTIQDAVDAAQADLLSLFDGDGTQFTVGVDTGVYTESVEINWNLQLLGSDPDQTTIVGIGGPAVTLSGTVGTKVEGFTLIGDGPEPIGLLVTGGSYGVEINRNLIKDNQTGIMVDGRSSGSAQFNTIISNTTGILTNGKYDWLDTNSNLLNLNTFGLYAETVTVTAVISTGIGMTTATGIIYSENNLLYNSVDYYDVQAGSSDIVGLDPMLTGDYGYLQLGSPAIDAGSTNEPVPTGGGIRADIGWNELIIPPISILMGQPDDSVATDSIGVGSVEYAIVPVASPTSTITSTLPVTWTTATLDSPGEKLSYWNAPFTPTSTGFYRIYSRATDSLGNAEIDTADWYEGAFYVDDTAPVVTLSVDYASGVGQTWLRLTGVVTDYIGTSFDVDDVYFTVNGERYEGRWSLEPWEPDGVTPRKFHYIFVNDTGSPIVDAQIQAFAVDGAGQVGSSAVQTKTVAWDIHTTYYDATPPEIWYFNLFDELLPIPPYDVIVGGDAIHFQGQAKDIKENVGTNPQEGFTGINGYQISVDGGLTWGTIPAYPGDASEHNGYFTYTLELPEGFDATSVPMKVRVTDYGGLSRAQVFTFTIDTGAPRLVGEINVDSEAAIGMHLDQNSTVTFTWDLPIDGSSVTHLLGNFGSADPNVPPTNPIYTTTYVAEIDDPNFGAQIGAADEVGNVDWRYFGPWYLGQLYGVPWPGSFQSIELTMDGFLDIQHDEWLTDTEWLDTDERPGIDQSLYATWSGRRSYIGWQGANWDEDGTMWIYWDLYDGGTTTPVSGTVSLPFEADYAVRVSDEWTSTGWKYDGSAWVNDLYVEMASDPETRGTELSIGFDLPLPLGSTLDFDHHRLFAFAENNNGDVWSAFPIINKLDGDFNYYYEWQNIVVGTDLLSLPASAQDPSLTFSAASTPPVQDTLTNGSAVDYVFEISNIDNRTSENVQVQLNGSAGVNYLSVSGATCNDCALANSWLLDVPNLAPGESQTITVTAQLDNDLTGLEAVTTTVQVQTELPLPLVATLVHTLDLTPPSVTTSHHPGYAIGHGLQTFLGTADDNFGTGVEKVEVSLDGIIWQTATGTNSWSAAVSVPTSILESESTFDLYVRATDYHGQVSGVSTVTFTVDDIAPEITPNVPPLVGNATTFSLNGTTSDPAPVGALVQSVDAQFDSAANAWKTGAVGTAVGNGQQSWSYPWLLPNEDGVTHTVRFRATDFGGNVTASDWYTTVVDTVAPVITLTQQSAQVPAGGTPLAGLVTDGYAFDVLSAVVYTAGNTITETIPVVNDSWSYTFNQPVGNYWLVLTGQDTAGNSAVMGPFPVEVIAAGFPGDPSCDGSRDVIDALYIMQREVGLRGDSNNCPPEPDTLYLPGCDVNGDNVCDVVDALYIMQCEVGIPNSLCPGADEPAGKSQVEGMVGGLIGESAENKPPSQPSMAPSTIHIGSGEAAVGESLTIPVQVNVPDGNSLTAVTLDIAFDPAVVEFTDCEANSTDFSLSLCNLSEGDGNSPDIVSFTALAVVGVSGDLSLGNVTFTGLAEGITNLTLTARAFDDGSGVTPVMEHGTLTVGDGSLSSVTYISPDSAGTTADGLAYGPEDILVYDGSWSLYFDGSEHGLTGANIDGFHIRPNGDLLLSFAESTMIRRGLTVEPEDIALYKQARGRFSMIFDGSDVGLSGNNVDGIALTEQGLLLSLTEPFDDYDPADVLRFEPTRLGSNTRGSWFLHFDADTVPNLAGSQTDGLWQAEGGDLYLTTAVSFGGFDTADIYSSQPALVMDMNGAGLNATGINGLYLAPTGSFLGPDMAILDSLN